MTEHRVHTEAATPRFRVGDVVYPMHHYLPGLPSPYHDTDDLGTVTDVVDGVAVVRWHHHDADQEYDDVDEHDAVTGVCRHHSWTIRQLHEAREDG